MDKKGQLSGGGWALISTVLALVVLMILISVSLVTTSSVNQQLNLPADNLRVINESYVPAITDAGPNATTLAEDGFVTGSDSVKNQSGDALTRDTDYTITLFGGASGDLTTQANITLFNLQYNATQLQVSYSTKEQSDFQATQSSIEAQNLSALQLTSTGQIVLAAIAILTIVVGIVYLFSRGRS